MNIRDATEADFPELMPMAARFAELAYGDVGLSADRESCEATVRLVMQNGVFLVTEDLKAMLGLLVIPWWFNRAYLTANEVFWWAENGQGRALREEGERRVKELGATSISMACEHDMRSVALERLYRSMGYLPREHTYLKELV